MIKARPRRLRASLAVRNMVKETILSAQHFIAPFFVVEGQRIRKPILSMPGQFQLSLDQVLVECARAHELGVSGVILFGIPRVKNALGTGAYARQGIVQKAVRAIKKKFPNLIVFTDLCLCEYTSHGHCGVLKKNRQGEWDVDNDATLSLLAKAAVAQAEAGADFVAPSGMMDGAVRVLREALDKKGFIKTGILAYAAKYASVFYGPFRDAAESAPKFGNRQTYQMDPANQREGLNEIAADLMEGADMVMVKPALSYLDVIAKARPFVNVPLVAYNVSGEYAMVKAAQEKGWVGDSKTPTLALEILTSIKRAGADLIITYHALDVAAFLARLNP